MASKDKETKSAEANTYQFPDFPKSLTKADRQMLACGAAEQWATDHINRATEAGVKITPFEQMMMQMVGTLIVNHRWTAERLEDLEGKQK